MDNKEYNVARLDNPPIEKVRSLEKKLSEEKGEEVILIAYTKT